MKNVVLGGPRSVKHILGHEYRRLNSRVEDEY